MMLAPLALAAVAPATLAQVPSGGTLRHTPPIVAMPPTQQRLLRWMPGPVRCSGAAFPAPAVRRPWSGLLWGDTPPAAVTLRFRLDAGGRVLGIAREGSGYVPGGSGDLAPSLASSRFPPAAAERTGCTVTYTPAPVVLADAPLDELTSYSINPTAGTLPRPGYDRVYTAGDCTQAPRPRPLLAAYPDFDKIAGTPGARDWVMLGYDLTAKGRPAGVRVLTGTQNAALEAAGIAALGQARFTHGPRTGCRFAFWKSAPTLPAPPAPEEAAFRPPTATCPAKHDWARKPALVFPEAWRRRGIEGWAMIGYDVAPWGATGNVRVLAAEPAAEFGDSAAGIIRSATVVGPGTGLVGCVDRVKFRMGPDGDEPADRAGGGRLSGTLVTSAG